MNEQERGTFDQLLGEYIDKFRRDLELSLNQSSGLLSMFAGDPMQDSIPSSVDTEGMDGEDPWSR